MLNIGYINVGVLYSTYIIFCPQFFQGIYIIILDPDERPTTVRSNDTLVDTPFQLISGFFHVNQGVLCSEHAEQASSRGVWEGGGGGGGREQQAW